MASTMAFSPAFMAPTVAVPAHLMMPWTEMPVIRSAMSVVTPVIIVPVVMDPVYRVPAEPVWNAVDAHRYPRPVVIRRGIPCTAAPEPVVVAVEIKVVRHADRDVEPELRRRHEFRRRVYYHRRSAVCGRDRDADIDPEVEIDVAGVRLRYRQYYG